MIVSSFRQQYGLRIKSDEFKSMNWDEFTDLINGLNETTSLVKVIQVRTETDPEILKQYTPAQREMRRQWQIKVAKHKSRKETDDFIASMQEAFKKLAKEG